MRCRERPIVPLHMVLVAAAAEAVPGAVPWPERVAPASVSLWCGEAVGSADLPPWCADAKVNRVGGHDGSGTGGWRRRLARVVSSVRARQYGVSPRWLWDLKADRRLASALRGADLLITLDAPADAALRCCADLARGRPWLNSAHASPHGPIWQELMRWCEAGDGHDSVVPEEPPVLAQVLTRHLEIHGMQAAESLPNNHAQAVVHTVDALLERLGSPGRLAASAAFLELWQHRPVGPSHQWDQIVDRSLGWADEAWATGDRRWALQRLHSAITVVLHRGRHAETLSSPLIENPGAHLSALRASTTWRDVHQIETPRPAVTAVRATHTARLGPSIPRVVVLPGAYGNFHHDLVASLEGRAEVRVVPLTKQATLRRRRLYGGDLLLWDALRRGEVDVAGRRWRRCPAGVDVSAQLTALRDLARAVGSADVVVGEWFDAGTMWASHLVPEGTPMVVRAHGVDLVDPWVHLMDWRGVDRVLSTTAALAGLFTDLTAGTGAPTPRIVLPFRPDLAFQAPVRDAECRFTAAMVGWGRVVKDPDFALDLLERDPRRRLILIGPDSLAAGPGLNQGYADAFERRVRSSEFAGRVQVVGRTDDVPQYLAQAGVIVSASRREGWHLGLIEGAASGAVPIVRDWPLLSSRAGARTTHPPEWVVDDVEDADRRWSALSDEPTWRAESRRAREVTLQRYAAQPAARAYRAAVLEHR